MNRTSGPTENISLPVTQAEPPLAKPGDVERECRNLAYDVLDGAVVPVLGAGVNVCERPSGSKWRSGSYLPTGSELAKLLADQSAYTPDLFTREPGSEEAAGARSSYEPVYDLLRVSQYVEVTKGPASLHRTLHEVFVRPYGPSIVHQFLARLAKASREPLLMLTTNYDDALEQAFQEAGVSYDLVTYVADYPKNRRGHFTRSVWNPGDGVESEPKAIGKANTCFDVLEERPAIVKIHGAVRRGGDYTQDNYVISEDDYIDYLVHSDAAKRFPVGVTKRLPDSHFLFLGYSLRDWNLRVILRRIWQKQSLKARSWSVRLDADEIDELFWVQQGVKTLRYPLPEFVLTLRRICLAAFLNSFADDAPEERTRTIEETRPEALFERLPNEQEDRPAMLGALQEEHLKLFLESLPEGRRGPLLAELPEALVAEVRKARGTGPASPGG